MLFIDVFLVTHLSQTVVYRYCIIYTWSIEVGYERVLIYLRIESRTGLNITEALTPLLATRLNQIIILKRVLLPFFLHQDIILSGLGMNT